MKLNFIFIDEDGTKHATNAEGKFDDPEAEEVRIEAAAMMAEQGIIGGIEADDKEKGPAEADVYAYIMRNPPPRVTVALTALAAMQELAELSEAARKRDAAQFN